MALLADKAKIVYSPAEVFFAFGKPGTLDCHFHSNPPLTKIRWEKDGFLFDTYNVPGVYHKLNGSLYFDRVSSKCIVLYLLEQLHNIIIYSFR